MSYSINDFAATVGLTAHTLRYYEKEQLLSVKRNHGGQRYYTEQDKDWILFIKKLKEAGMPIKEIKTYAELRTIGDSTLQQRLDLLTRHQQMVVAKLAEWQDNVNNLNDKIKYYQHKIEQA